MLFYEVKANIDGQVETKDNETVFPRGICKNTLEFNQKHKDVYGFLHRINSKSVTLGFITQNKPLQEELVPEFLKTIEVTDSECPFTIKEITIKAFVHMLGRADNSSFIEDADDIMQDFGIEFLAHRGPCFNLGEETLQNVNKKTKAELIENAKNILCGDTLIPEIERIFSCDKSKLAGHPVHYIIESTEDKICEKIVEILLTALRKQNRITANRYSLVGFGRYHRNSDDYRKLLKASSGSSVRVKFDVDDEDESEYVTDNALAIIDTAERLREFKNQVLHIICLPRESEKMKNLFLENCDNISFITIKEDLSDCKKSKQYLRRKAKEIGVEPNEKLTSKIKTKEKYLPNELNKIFDEWYDEHLLTEIYTQYTHSNIIKCDKNKKSRGNAHNELMELIGLNNAKTVINQALDFYKARMLFADKGIKQTTPSMHMVFTGNPGTAKTTVARLFAKIMKENEVLNCGQLIEVGRADLIGKYVGHTAPLVKKAFERAKGGVLFIDEAYSLVDDKDGMYGDEAINTIVQEMENMRDEVVVIFAGYPDKMENFLDKNPGLRSRIAFHVLFDDYSSDELLQITDFIAKQSNVEICDNAKDKLLGIYNKATKQADFGNGRYARNMVEKAKMKQATRLLAMGVDNVTKTDVHTLIAADFEEPLNIKKIKVLGFAS